MEQPRPGRQDRSMNSQTPIPDDGQPTEPLLPPPAAAQETPPASPPDTGYQAPYGRDHSQSTDFFGWIRSHGIHRGRDRWIGGVSSGLAQRFGIDPLILRGIFIVLTLFAGIGVLLYGLAWAFLPEPDGRIHVQEAGAGRWASGMTGALITTIIGLTGLGGGFWGWSHNGFGGFLWTVFWVGGAIYLIYYLTQRSKARNGAPTTANPRPAGPGGNAAFAAAHPPAPYPPVPPTSVNPPYGGGRYGGGSDGGGVYGGGYQPPQGPPYAPKARPPGPGAPAVAITVGSALLVGGGLKALGAGNMISLGEPANAIVWASGAAVLGLGIIIAGMRGRTSGILGFFAAVALLVGGIFNVVGDGKRVRFTQVDWTPASISQATDGYNVTAGRGTVDLTKLRLGTPLTADVVVPLDITASNVTVVIPNDVPVYVMADMTMGNMNEGANYRRGISTRESSYNTDLPGARLVVAIDGTFSNVTIQEGNRNEQR